MKYNFQLLTGLRGLKGITPDAKISVRTVRDILLDTLYISVTRACKFLWLIETVILFQQFIKWDRFIPLCDSYKPSHVMHLFLTSSLAVEQQQKTAVTVRFHQDLNLLPVVMSVTLMFVTLI